MTSRHPIDPARLRYARNLRGLTLRQLGDLVGVSIRTIQRYEQGHGEPTEAVLDQMALHLQVRNDWLCGEDGERDAPRLQCFQKAEVQSAPSLFDLVSRIVALPREDRAALLRLLQSETQATG